VIGLAALALGALLAAGIYLLLAPSAQRVVIGFLLVSNGVNLFVLTAAGMPEGAAPPLIRDDVAATATADPLAQAFILTAIVIGFGMAAFLLAMAADVHRGTGSDDLADEDDR
jgi:multicomponent Na+:H+ antiporter subunit C